MLNSFQGEQGMKILIIGGGGMIGQKLLHRLLETLEAYKISNISLFDLYLPALNHTHVTLINGDIGNPEEIQKLVKMRFDVIFHLAAIVSGEAEENFSKGWEINLFSMWRLLDGIRNEGKFNNISYMPRVIFTSSIAVFGAPYPPQIGDDFLCAPQTSYGAQKASAELMISDYSRKGFVDGISLRLPTICVRPGLPNKAASGFFSGIIREPLNGKKAYLPVGGNVRHWHASPKAATNFLMHTLNLDFQKLERRSLNLPGVSCTVEEQIEALRKIAGQSTVDLIIPKQDPFVESMVKGWPRDFKTEKAFDLGFKAEKNFEEIVKTYIEEDLEK